MKKGLGLICGCVLLLSGCHTSYFVFHYENADKYSIGDAEIATPINRIYVDWLNGNVTLNKTKETTLTINEKSNKELDAEYKVHYLVNGDILNIHFAASGQHNFNRIEKDLVINVPETFNLGKVEIDVASTDVFINDLTIEELIVKTVSGEVYIKSFVDILDVDTVSGDVDLFCSVLPSFLEMDTVSGDGFFYFPDNSAFKMEFDTISGDFSTNFEVTKSEDYYIFGHGTNIFTFDSVSGDLSINRLID